MHAKLQTATEQARTRDAANSAHVLGHMHAYKHDMHAYKHDMHAYKHDMHAYKHDMFSTSVARGSLPLKHVRSCAVCAFLRERATFCGIECVRVCEGGRVAKCVRANTYSSAGACVSMHCKCVSGAHAAWSRTQKRACKSAGM
jgi:hypothetical protein